MGNPVAGDNLGHTPCAATLDDGDDTTSAFVEDNDEEEGDGGTLPRPAAKKEDLIKAGA